MVPNINLDVTNLDVMEEQMDMIKLFNMLSQIQPTGLQTLSENWAFLCFAYMYLSFEIWKANIHIVGCSTWKTCAVLFISHKVLNIFDVINILKEF